MPEHPPDDPSDEGRGGRFRRLGRRFLNPDDHRSPPPRDDRRPEGLLWEAREVVGAVLEGSDKAKTELMRALAREVRTYLEEMGVKDDLKSLLTNYSLELKASVHLKRLVPEGAIEEDPKTERNRPAEEEARPKDHP